MTNYERNLLKNWMNTAENSRERTEELFNVMDRTITALKEQNALLCERIRLQEEVIDLRDEKIAILEEKLKTYAQLEEKLKSIFGALK